MNQIKSLASKYLADRARLQMDVASKLYDLTRTLPVSPFARYIGAVAVGGFVSSAPSTAFIAVCALVGGRKVGLAAYGAVAAMELGALKLGATEAQTEVTMGHPLIARVQQDMLVEAASAQTAYGNA